MVSRSRRSLRGAINAPLLAAGSYIVTLSLLGGGNTVFGLPVILMMLATIAFVAATMILQPAPPEASRALLVGLALVVCIPLVQILPLPPAIWQSLPGSALRADVLALIPGAGRWQPLSLEPVYTLQTLVMAVGFAALFWSVMNLDPRSFDRVLQLSLALVVAGILVGVVQVTTRGTFPNFFRHADTGSLIGFFSNKNHMALAIAASIPLAYAVLVRDRHGRPIQNLLFFAYWAVALVAILATTSRAGLGLGLGASLLIGLSMAGRIRMRLRIAIAVLLVAAVAIVASTATFQAMLARFDYLDEDNRWLFTLRSIPLVREYWLTGAGGGVFGDLFITSEPVDWVKPTIMNHVHNDYVEMIIEYGVAGAVALAALATGVVRAFLSHRTVSARMSRMCFGGAIIIALIALHSLVDYPLRRPAILALLAVALAMVARPQPIEERGRSQRRSARDAEVPLPV